MPALRRWGLRLRSAERSLTQTDDQRSEHRGTRRAGSCHGALRTKGGEAADVSESESPLRNVNKQGYTEWRDNGAA